MLNLCPLVVSQANVSRTILGLRLDFTRNNSGLRNYLDCSSAGSRSNISQCIGASGGVFDLNSSTTFHAVTNNAWNVTSIDPSPNGAHIIRGYDVADFGPNASVPEFPFEVWSASATSNRSSLGLGINSSVLSSLVGAGVAPSPEIGLFYGSRSIGHPSNGEMIIGGYNSGLVNGSFFNFSLGAGYLDQPCPLQVLLKDVVVTTSNGSRASIMPDPGARVPACVNPVENGFQFTPVMYNQWANLTQHPSNPPSDGSKNFSDQTYPLSNEALINELLITLEGGYQVTIPHFELVTLERGNNAQGLYDVINSSRIQTAVTSNGGRFTFPVLGGVFLSQNYLRVDYSRKVFSLAHASLDGTINGSAIVGTCMGDNVPIVSPSPSPSSSPTPAPSSRSGLGGGKIAGIVIGSVAGFFLLVALLLLLWRRSRPKGGPTVEPDHPSSEPGGPLPRRWSELDGTGKQLSEMPSSTTKDPTPILGPTAQFPSVMEVETLDNSHFMVERPPIYK